MPASDRKRRLTAFLVAMAVLIATPLAVVAADAFGDVPDSNVHHNDITWLADADITRGCNPPANDRFCPVDPVTRQQMASFLRRLAENQVVDAATAITAESAETAADADTVDGYHANELSRVDFATSDFEDTIMNDVHIATTITAPAPGYLSIFYTGSVVSESGDPDVWACLIGVNDVFPDPGIGFGQGLSGIFVAGCTAHLIEEVNAGTHAIEVAVANLADSAEFASGTLSVHFVPFGAAGGVSLASEPGPDKSLPQQLADFRTRTFSLGFGGS